MSTNKYINIFITVMMTFAVLFCLVLVFFSANGETEVVSASVSEFGYKNLLDRYHVMEVDICMDEREFAVYVNELFVILRWMEKLIQMLQSERKEIPACRR